LLHAPPVIRRSTLIPIAIIIAILWFGPSAPDAGAGAHADRCDAPAVTASR
jgi:hypothetical protein